MSKENLVRFTRDISLWEPDRRMYTLISAGEIGLIISENRIRENNHIYEHVSTVFFVSGIIVTEITIADNPWRENI